MSCKGKLRAPQSLGMAISDFFVQPPSKFYLKKKKRKTGSNVKLSAYLNFLPVNKMEGMTSHDSQ